MKNLEEVEEYGARVAPLIGLSHWRIHFKLDDGVGFAESEPEFEYKKCYVKINPVFFDPKQYEREDIYQYQKITIIHELIHCHFDFWAMPFNELMDSPDHAHNKFAIVRNIIRKAAEESVELLARSIYKILEKK